MKDKENHLTILQNEINNLNEKINDLQNNAINANIKEKNEIILKNIMETFKEKIRIIEKKIIQQIDEFKNEVLKSL